MVWFVFFRAPWHAAIVRAPMREKDIDPCLCQRSTHRSANLTAAARAGHNRESPGSMLREHLLESFRSVASCSLSYYSVTGQDRRKSTYPARGLPGEKQVDSQHNADETCQNRENRQKDGNVLRRC